MNRIIRTDPGSVFAKAVEFHGFVFTWGCTAENPAEDVRGQMRQVLAQLDALLETHGTDKTKLLQVQIWLKDIRDREAINEVWSAWLPAEAAPARACVQAHLADPRHLVEVMVTACK